MTAIVRNLYPSERAREERRDKALDALAKAKRRADWDDFASFDEGQDTECYLQTFVEVEWETVGVGLNPHDEARAANAHVLGARFGAILIDRETLDFAFPGQVDSLEERLSEEFTAKGEVI